MSKQIVQIYSRNDFNFHEATVTYGHNNSPSKTWKKVKLQYEKSNIRSKNIQVSEAKKLEDLEVF